MLFYSKSGNETSPFFGADHVDNRPWLTWPKTTHDNDSELTVLSLYIMLLVLHYPLASFPPSFALSAVLWFW